MSFRREWLERAPYRELHAQLNRAVRELHDWPASHEYDQLARSVPQPAGVELPRFVEQTQAALQQAGGYEQHVARLRRVPTRPGSWHDFFNMVVWAHFPRTRWALNALHVDPEAYPIDPRNGRAPSQNLAASFDESGLLVVSTSRSLLADLQALRFKRAFWQRRDELLRSTRFFVTGHGLLEALLTPLPGMVGRAILLHRSSLPPAGDDELRCELDAWAAERVASFRHVRHVLDPIPVLAIPGWADNDAASFYDERQNLRFEPISRRTHGDFDEP